MARKRMHVQCHRPRPGSPTGRSPSRPGCRLPLWPSRHKIECHCRRDLTHLVRISSLSRIHFAPRTGPQLAWLSALPTECRSHLIDYGHPIADRLHGSTHCKQAITDRSRKIHFLSWCHDVGLPDPCTPELPLQGRNWIIACYAVSLLRGRTITGVRIRHATLLGYIKQAVTLHIDRGLPNPQHVDINYIKVMTNAVKK